MTLAPRPPSDTNGSDTEAADTEGSDARTHRGITSPGFNCTLSDRYILLPHAAPPGARAIGAPGLNRLIATLMQQVMISRVISIMAAYQGFSGGYFAMGLKY